MEGCTREAKRSVRTSHRQAVRVSFEPRRGNLEQGAHLVPVQETAKVQRW
jgi:hypothetical protein